MGELHLEIIVDRMKREFTVEANVGQPQVAYRETIRGKADADKKFAKQTGGHGQYAHVKIRIEPFPPPVATSRPSGLMAAWTCLPPAGSTARSCDSVRA